jgi:hypothetical protein
MVKAYHSRYSDRAALCITDELGLNSGHDRGTFLFLTVSRPCDISSLIFNGYRQFFMEIKFNFIGQQ